MLYTYIQVFIFICTIQQLLGFRFAHVAIVAMKPFAVGRVKITVNKLSKADNVVQQ